MATSKFNLNSKSSLPADMAAAAKSSRDAARAISDLTQRAKEYSRSVSLIEETAKQLANAGGSSSSSSSSSSGSGSSSSKGGDLGSQGAAIAAQMRASLEPIAGLAAKIAAQFNVVGGAIVTAARRLDGFIKAPGQEKFLNTLEVRFPGAFTKIGISAFRAYSKVHGFFTNFGDVAGKSLDRVAKVRFTAPIQSAKQLAAAIPGVTAATNAATSSVKSFGRELLVALGVFGAAYKVTEFFVGAVKGAVDLNETLSATNVTFGASSTVVTKFADDMAAKFGLVKGETLNVANGFGDFASASGKGSEEAAAFSVKMTKLSADLSSFKNIPFEEAAQKISSGLAGEAEPLRRFGVLLSADAVAAKAVALGLATSTKEISENAKVSARAALIQEGLAKASGDLDRTQGDAANQFRKAGGGLTNFATAIGSTLMPAVKEGIGILNEMLASVIELFEGTKPTLQSWVSYATAGIAQVGVIIRNFGDYWTIAGIKAREFGANFIAILETLPGNVVTIASYIGRNWDALIRDGVYGSITVLKNFGSYLGELAVAVFNWLKDPTSKFEAPNWKPLFEGFTAEAEKLPELIKPAWASLQAEIDAVGSKIASKEADRAKRIADAAKEASKVVDAVASPEASKKFEEDKYAGLALKGSKEAYSATLKAQNGNSADPIKDVVKANNQQVNLQQQMLTELRKQNAGPAALPAFGM